MTIRLFVSALLAAFALNAAAAVDVNTASRADLETVKGVGPGLSNKIIEARKAAPFKDWSDMVERVGGIGPGNAARFSQAGMTVAGAAYEAGSAKPADAAKPKALKRTDKESAKGPETMASNKNDRKNDKKRDTKAEQPAKT
ncbi:MAG TPA: helix-hairpin-helix domain-containing protein [Rubrivivax sp.]|jgi:competence protein ComEA|nr:helix-hairpin-helix domain-containing protein [Rubrivivax sp.]